MAKVPARKEVAIMPCRWLSAAALLVPLMLGAGSPPRLLSRPGVPEASLSRPHDSGPARAQSPGPGATLAQPQVGGEGIREQLEHLREQVEENLARVREQLGPRLARAREEAEAGLARIREQLEPQLERLRGQLDRALGR